MLLVHDAPSLHPMRLSTGLWPGIRNPGVRGDADVASASREPWIDASGFLAASQRALGLPTLLSHEHKDPARGVP